MRLLAGTFILPMPAPLRHFDDGKTLMAYADQVAVRCHRCGTPGMVTAQWEPYFWQARFRCAHCSVALDLAQGDWAGPVAYRGRRPCGYCGTRWLHVNKQLPMRPASPCRTIDATCHRCQRVSAVEVHLSACRSIGGNPAFDPHFGLPLLLVEATRTGTLWVYNLRHLRALRAYVEASLRTHGPVSNRSMFSRLPAWMKLARNRTLVLRHLQRLQRAAIDRGFTAPEEPE